MNSKNQQAVLIISYGPVPTPKYQKIEGGGMRCWGLALGLHSKGYAVTIGVNAGFPLDIEATDEGIKLINWQEDDHFKELINLYDTVIVSYSMGGPTSFVVNHISDHITLVLDCYVPIYIEVSARDSKDKETEYINYGTDILHYNKALKRGDFFLCANIPQKHMYMGALSTLGVVNPYSYKKERVLLVPFGVESSLKIDGPRNPYKEIGINKDDFTLLWFGGLYPWFNIKPLLEVVRKLSKKEPRLKLVIVGGKNPYNSHPDFIQQYEFTHNYAVEHNLVNKIIFFIDWVDFNDRINWYQNADVVISINNIGEENVYSWRTRVMDYVWGEIPMITNGGDPLSDELIEAGAAIRLDGLEEEHIYDGVERLLNSRQAIREYKENLLTIKSKYYWENVVAPLDIHLQKKEKPFLDEKEFSLKLGMGLMSEEVAAPSVKTKVKKVASLPMKLAKKVKQKGIRRSAAVALTTLKNRTTKSTLARDKRYYFLSHPIDFTGAPLVLLDAVEDFSEKVNPKSISVIYPGGERLLLRRLRQCGVLAEKMVMGIGSRVIHAQLGIRRDDFVLMNTVAIYPNYRDYIFGLLETNRLNKAYWFIHEDMPELRFDDKGLIARVTRLLKENKLHIYVPSSRTADDYKKFFKTENVSTINLRVEVGNHTKLKRTADDFNKIKFVISGTPSDGRKGQVLAISAFYKYLQEIQAKDPKRYRDFELHLISIGDDYISQQIKALGSGLLNDKVNYYPKISKEAAMAITAKSNVTICCSLNETFALFVAEGMLMGHVLLRNNTSGVEEQLIDGKNGYLIHHEDLIDFAKKIALVLDKQKTTNTQLHEMSKASKEIAEKFVSANYYDQLN